MGAPFGADFLADAATAACCECPVATTGGADAGGDGFDAGAASEAEFSSVESDVELGATVGVAGCKAVVVLACCES